MKAFKVTLTVVCSETTYADLKQEAVDQGYQDLSQFLESQLADEFDDVGMVVEASVIEQAHFAIQT